MGYFSKNMDEKIGNIAAGGRLGVSLEELGPVICVKAPLPTFRSGCRFARISELDIEIHEDGFHCWRKFDQQRKRKG